MSNALGALVSDELLQIVDALRDRARYRYVQPVVLRAEPGWRIVSPCCSRNVDPDGGVIDIAWLEPTEDGGWRSYARDHKLKRWALYDEAADLSDLLDVIRTDPKRIFWP
jgi:hypothetical protein